MPSSAQIAVRLFALVCVLALASAAAAETPKKEKGKDAGAKPSLVASYGDWSVYESESGKTRICYTLAQPKERQPDDVKRDPAYAFISERPSERVRNEVSFVMGFDVAGAPTPAKEEKKEDKEDRPKAESKDKQKKAKSEPIAPTATVGDAEFDLLPKGADLWVKNPAEESQLIDEMRKGVQLKVKAAAKKGNVTVDTYSLTGFKQAIERALKECPGA